MVPTTITRITANITAYSAISWASSPTQAFQRTLTIFHLPWGTRERLAIQEGCGTAGKTLTRSRAKWLAFTPKCTADCALLLRAAVGAATRSLCGLGAVRTAAWPTASLSQRLLRAGFCDPLRHHPAAGCAYSREELSAPWFATVSAAGGGGLAVDPGGIFARDQHAAGGAGSGHPDRRSGERADGLETDPRSGRGGSPVSPGPAER